MSQPPADDPWAAAVRVERRVALLGLALAGTLLGVTGAYLSLHEGANVGMPSFREDLARGMLARNLHRLGTQAIAVVAGLHAAFLVVTRFTRQARVVGLGLGATLVVLLAVVTALPWDQISIWMVSFGSTPAPLVGHEGPFADMIGVSPRYDAQALLPRPAFNVVERRLWMIHALVVPVLGAGLLALHLRRGKVKA